MCSHCKARFLKGMLPAETPEALVSVMRKIHGEGANGFLLSGGFDEHGSLPLKGLMEAIAEGKRETGLLINVHTGMQDRSEFEALRRAFVDCVSLDLLDEGKQGRRYPLDYRLEDYIENAVRAVEAGLRVVPHFTVGLNASNDRVVTMLPGGVFPRVIVNVLIEEGAANDSGHLKSEAIHLVSALSASGKTREVVVGCMRPRGDATFEARLFDAGASGMVNPHRDFVVRLKSEGVTTRISENCCAL